MTTYSSIKSPSYEEALAKKQAQDRKRAEKRATVAKCPKKRISKGIPRWIKAIPESNAHGSGTYQKRLWKLVSDYVRIRDWYKYGVCTATGKRIEHWTEGHAGHLKPYTGCNGLFKFDVRNIHLQHGNSNKFGNFDTFREMEKVVRSRGYDFDAFEKENNQQHGCSLRDPEVIEQMKVILHMMKDLKEQPPYYERAISLLND